MSFKALEISRNFSPLLVRLILQRYRDKLSNLKVQIAILQQEVAHLPRLTITGKISEDTFPQYSSNLLSKGAKVRL
jgi:hypothetical protein